MLKHATTILLFRADGITRDDEGHAIAKYEEPVQIRATVYPATEYVGNQMVGFVKESKLKMLYEGKGAPGAGDAVALDTSATEPTHRIVASLKYSKHYQCDLEEMR